MNDRQEWMDDPSGPVLNDHLQYSGMTGWKPGDDPGPFSPVPDVPQTVENLSNELCVGAEPDQPVKTQDELLTALDELLDSALHDDRCYIHENDTECVCVIGKVRAALPPCGAVRIQRAPERPSGKRVLRCHRSAHPASPDMHVF